MDSRRIAWSSDSFLDGETGLKLEDRDVLEIMDRSARHEEIFVSLPRTSIFPVRNGQFFEDWQIRVITHGGNRIVRLFPASERTKKIVMARMIDWMRDNFDYDEDYIQRYVEAGFGLPRVWIRSTVQLVDELMNHTTKLRLVVGDGTRIRERLKVVGIPLGGVYHSRDIETAIRIVEKMKQVPIFHPT